jgi:serine acetyltransferase
MVENIKKVNIPDVEKIGRKYFPVSHATIVVVGENEEISEQLSVFGLVTKIQK